jgi:isopentenyl diphosphate isomerase/L-lactate dehydrogenase-like FMN-dependent dehydrogenase
MASIGQLALNIHDLEVLARRRLPRGLFEFANNGAEDEVTMRENLASIKRIALRPRVGVDVSRRDISTTLFGRKQSMPIVLGVTGFSGMIAWRGEQSVAAAATAAGVPYTIGTFNFVSVRELPDEVRPGLWYQLYPARQREAFDHQLLHARAAGVGVLVVTMDSAVAGNREYLRRTGFGMPPKLMARTLIDGLAHPRWLFGTYLRHRTRGMPRLGNVPPALSTLLDPRTDCTGILPADTFSWDDLRRLRDRWPGQLVLKGLSTAEDALIAADLGADGVVVSNHGGRSLDGCIASMAALPEVVDAVGSRLTVMVDGGFTRGSDVVKALAIDAAAVLVGRATIFGLAAAGRAGVARALAIFREEIDRTLAQVGCCRIAELSRAHVRQPSAPRYHDGAAGYDGA